MEGEDGRIPVSYREVCLTEPAPDAAPALINVAVLSVRCSKVYKSLFANGRTPNELP